MPNSEDFPISGNDMGEKREITEGYTNIGDFEIYYQTIGLLEFSEKPVIIFLHEGLGSTESWGSFAYELSDELRLPALLYDRRGYARSSSHYWVGNSNYLHEEAELLDLLIDKFSIKEPIIFGHSDGATIALIYGGKYSGKTKAVISVAAHTFVEQHTLEGVRKAIKVYENTRLRDKLTKIHGRKTDVIFYSWALTWTSESIVDWNIFNELENISCPVLVLQGDNDQYGTDEQVNSIIERNKTNSESMILKDCGHIPHLEKHMEMIGVCGKFIKSCN